VTVALHRKWNTFDLINRFIALTEFTAQKLLESGLTTRDKISILGNFLSNPLPMPGSFEKREPYVVYLGRLSPEKGITILLEAMAGLSDLKLKMMGDGPQAEALRATARGRGLHHVEFLGHTVGDEKWNLLRRAMAVILPSVCYENFPIVVLESLAVGTPVVASKLGSLPHVIEDGKSGLLFSPGDSQDLQQKLAWLGAHPQEALAMGRYGRQIVETEYNAETHYKRLMKIYDEVRY
jgi:glycosyltransferase involved in cell wall biosynthesis